MTREPLTEAKIRLAHNRRCPYCRSDSSRAVGTRVDIWASCQNCRSIFRDITPARFQQIHDEAFQDSWYIECGNALVGREPSGALWAGLALPGASVLEIAAGPVLASRTVNPAAKTALAPRFYSAAAPCDPVYRLRRALGRAGSLKARLTR
jgi:hypothetical protein